MSTHRGQAFDWDKLAAELDEAVRERKVTWEQVALEIGCNTRTLNYLRKGERGLSVELLMPVLRWLHEGRSPLLPYESVGLRTLPFGALQEGVR